MHDVVELWCGGGGEGTLVEKVVVEFGQTVVIGMTLVEEVVYAVVVFSGRDEGGTLVESIAVEFGQTVVTGMTLVEEVVYAVVVLSGKGGGSVVDGRPLVGQGVVVFLYAINHCARSRPGACLLTPTNGERHEHPRRRGPPGGR